LSPNDKSLRAEFERIKKIKADQQAKDKNFLAEAFSKGIYTDKDAQLTKHFDSLP
jgi:hypothetical protein